jgi:hypothetical protein
MFLVQQLATPLHPHVRGEYLERVAELLRGCEIGDGNVARAARQAQGEFTRAPALDERSTLRPSKWSR